MNPKRLKRTGGSQRLEGKPFRLAKEVASIQRRAAEHDGCLVTIGQLVLFSTETGDAWMLDPSDRLAARLARDGDPEPIDLQRGICHISDRAQATIRGVSASGPRSRRGELGGDPAGMARR